MCFFIHGKLNTVGNLAGWIHEAMMHKVCVGTYLEEFAKQGTKMQELGFSKALHLFCLVLVHLPYLWTMERCVGVMYAAPCVFFCFVPAKG